MWDQFWPSFYTAMMLGFDSTSTTNGEAAWKTFCDMDSDLDAIRGVTMKKYTGK